MKSLPVISQVGYWKGSDPLVVLSFVVAAYVGMEVGEKWHFCCRSSRNVEGWGTFVRTGCRKTLGVLGVPVSVLRCLPSCPLPCNGGETQILSQVSGQKS